MSTSLKTLIGKAKTYYAAMEANRYTNPFTTPTSKILIFDQLLEQFNSVISDPRYIYKARKENQTPDQVVAEIIYLALTDGITIQDDTNKPLKVSFNDPGVLHASATMLKILDNCAQAQLGDLSLARARQNIARLERAYKLKMEHVDAEAEFLQEAYLLLDSIEHQHKAAQEQLLKERQVEKLAHQEELARLNLQHQHETARAKETIMILRSELEDNSRMLDELHNRGSNLETVTNIEIEHYEIALADCNAAIIEYQRQIKELTARCDAISFLHKETIEREQNQVDSFNFMLNRYESLLRSSREIQAGRDGLLQQLKAAKDEKAQLEPQLAELLAQLQSKDEELAERDKSILELTAAAAAKLKEHAALRTAKKEAQDAQEKSVKLGTRSQEQVQSSLETIATQNDKIKELNEQVALLQEQVLALEQPEAPKASAAGKKAKSPKVIQEGAEKTGYLNGGDAAYSQHPELMFNNGTAKRRLLTKSAQVSPLTPVPLPRSAGPGRRS